MRLNIVILVVLLLRGSMALGQSTFQNLDFETAQLVPIPGDPNRAVQFTAAFPGWSGYVGGQLQTTTVPNFIPLSVPFPPPFPSFISIMGPPAVIGGQGLYEVGFGAGTDTTGSLIPVALVQTGQVPSDARSLQFLGLYASAISIFLGGQQLSAVPLTENITSRRYYGVDISPFSGQVVELRFQPGVGIDYLEDIQFSPQGIPEPSVFGLFALGSWLIGWRWRRNRK